MPRYTLREIFLLTTFAGVALALAMIAGHPAVQEWIESGPVWTWTAPRPSTTTTSVGFVTRHVYVLALPLAFLVAGFAGAALGTLFRRKLLFACLGMAGMLALLGYLWFA